MRRRRDHLRASADGSDVLYSTAQVQAGVARFECVRSESGQCHYTVYPGGCAPTATGPVAGCAAEPLQRFAIVRGASRQIAGLHGFSLCVSAEEDPRGPDCETTPAVAAR